MAAALLWVTLSSKAEISGLTKKLNAATEEAKDLRNVNATLRLNYAEVAGGLRQCNAGVEAMARTTGAIAQAGTAAVKKVQAAGTQSTRRAAEIMAQRAETCEDAFKVLKEGIQ